MGSAFGCWGLPQDSLSRVPLMINFPKSSSAALSALALKAVVCRQKNGQQQQLPQGKVACKRNSTLRQVPAES